MKSVENTEVRRNVKCDFEPQERASVFDTLPSVHDMIRYYVK